MYIHPSLRLTLLLVTVVEVKQPKPPTHPDCTGTKLCMMSCKGKAILGEHGRDGCQSCACVPGMNEVHVLRGLHEFLKSFLLSMS